MGGNPRRSQLWILCGPVLGAGLFSVVAALLVAASGEWQFAAVAFVIGGIVGGIGGLLTGCIGAVVIRALDYRGERANGRVDATVGGVIGGAIAATFGIWVVVDSDAEAKAWLLLVAIPTAVAAGAAGYVGAWIWRRTAHT
jgi:hypothetical protein